jgi:hypothetical protein
MAGSFSLPVASILAKIIPPKDSLLGITADKNLMRTSFSLQGNELVFYLFFYVPLQLTVQDMTGETLKNIGKICRSAIRYHLVGKYVLGEEIKRAMVEMYEVCLL